MKIRVELKDPDGFYESVRNVAQESLPEGLREHEKESLLALRMDEISEKLERWVKYGECVAIEFDLDEGTATVVKQ